jgi:hypothetical protein
MAGILAGAVAESGLKAPDQPAGIEPPEEAVPVARTEAVGEENAPWPGEADEAAFLAGSPAGAVVSAPAGPEGGKLEAENGNGGKKPALPPLEELVARVPAEARAVLDELFRAKFTTVRWVREQDYKT